MTATHLKPTAKQQHASTASGGLLASACHFICAMQECMHLHPAMTQLLMHLGNTSLPMQCLLLEQNRGCICECSVLNSGTQCSQVNLEDRVMTSGTEPLVSQQDVVDCRTCAVLGKAMTSLMEGAPASSMMRRSSPTAIPPWGGAPVSKASSK